MATTHPRTSSLHGPMSLPRRRVLDKGSPLTWLRRGAEHFRSARGLSLAYGAVFAAIGLTITWLGLSRPQFILTFWTGFLLVGPLFAMGLYRIAQMQERGEAVTLRSFGQSLRRRLKTMALFSLLLSLVMVAWIRFSTLAAALYVGNITGTSSFINAMASPDGVGFILLLFGVGGVFAAIMFALTAWSLPMMLDGHADFATAVIASVRATIEQPIPMLIWGGIVAGLTLIGMLTFFIGFVVIFPLLGYATWAAYRDLFERD